MPPLFRTEWRQSIWPLLRGLCHLARRESPRSPRREATLLVSDERPAPVFVNLTTLESAIARDPLGSALVCELVWEQLSHTRGDRLDVVCACAFISEVINRLLVHSLVPLVVVAPDARMFVPRWDYLAVALEVRPLELRGFLALIDEAPRVTEYAPGARFSPGGHSSVSGLIRVALGRVLRGRAACVRDQLARAFASRHHGRVRLRDALGLTLLLVPFERRRSRDLSGLFHEARIQLIKSVLKRPEIIERQALPQRPQPALRDIARAVLRPRELLHVVDMHTAPA